MLMHARSATVLASSPALIRVPHGSPARSSPSSRSLFVYLAKFDSPTRSDLTSRSLLVPRLSPPHRAPPSCHRWFPLGIHLLFSLSSSRSSDGNARLLLHLASHFHWREVVVVGFFSRHPAFRLAGRLDGRRPANRPAELGAHFLVAGRRIFFSIFFRHRASPRNESTEFSRPRAVDRRSPVKLENWTFQTLQSPRKMSEVC